MRSRFSLSILPLNILFYTFQIWYFIRKVCLLQILIYIYNSFHLIFYLYIFNDINIYLHFFQTPSTTSGLTDTEKKEKIALEKKLSEMEEELKVTIDFRLEYIEFNHYSQMKFIYSQNATFVLSWAIESNSSFRGSFKGQ